MDVDELYLPFNRRAATKRLYAVFCVVVVQLIEFAHKWRYFGEGGGWLSVGIFCGICNNFPNLAFSHLFFYSVYHRLFVFPITCKQKQILLGFPLCLARQRVPDKVPFLQPLADFFNPFFEPSPYLVSYLLPAVMFRTIYDYYCCGPRA